MMSTKQSYQYPANFQKCEIHRMARRLYRGELLPQNKCECCQKYVGQKQTNFARPSQRLLALQQFMQFHKRIFYFLYLTCIQIASLFFIYLFSCQQHGIGCQYDWFMRTTFLSTLNNDSIVNSLIAYLFLLQIFMPLYTLALYGKIQKHITNKFKEFDIKIGDYAIKITRASHDTTNQDILMMIAQQNNKLSTQKQLQTDNLSVEMIIRIFNTQQYQKVEQQNMRQFKKLVKQNRDKQFQAKPLPIFTSENVQYTDTSFIIFKRKQSVQHFVSKSSFLNQVASLFCYSYARKSQNHQLRNKNISIHRSHQPSDINWRNCQYGMKNRMFRKFIIDSLSLGLLALGFYIQLQLKRWSDNNEDTQYGNIISMATGLLVSIYGQISYYFLIIGTQLQKPHSQTQKHKILMFRLSLYGFISYGLFPVSVQIFSDLRDFSIDQKLLRFIVSIVTSNQIINYIQVIVFDHFNIIDRVKLYLVRKFILRRSYFILTQNQVNTLYENSQFDFSYRYSYIISTVWIMLFYAPYIPLVFFISLIGLLLNYIFVKFMVSRNKISRPKVVSQELVNTACLLLIRNSFFSALGSVCVLVSLLYTGIIDSLPLNYLIIIVLICVIGVASWFIPFELLNKIGVILISCLKCIFTVCCKQEYQEKKSLIHSLVGNTQNSQQNQKRIDQMKKQYTKFVLTNKDMSLFKFNKPHNQILKQQVSQNFDVELSHRPYTDSMLPYSEYNCQKMKEIVALQKQVIQEEEKTKKNLLQYLEQREDSYNQNFRQNIYFQLLKPQRELQDLNSL